MCNGSKKTAAGGGQKDFTSELVNTPALFFMYKLIFLLWQAGCATVISMFKSNSVKKKGLRNAISAASALANGDRTASASSLALCKELAKLHKDGKYKAIFGMIETPVDFSNLSLKELSKCTQWDVSVLAYHDRATRALKPDAQASGNAGIPGTKQGGKYYKVNEWWSQLATVDSAKLVTMKKEAGELALHLVSGPTPVFVPMAGEGGGEGSPSKPTLGRKGAKQGSKEAASAHAACLLELRDRDLLQFTILAFSDQCFQAPPSLLEGDALFADLDTGAASMVPPLLGTCDYTDALSSLTHGEGALSKLPPEAGGNQGQLLATLIIPGDDEKGEGEEEEEEEEEEDEEAEAEEEDDDDDSDDSDESYQPRPSAVQKKKKKQKTAATNVDGASAGADELVSLTDVQEGFVEACWEQYERQGTGGHEMLSKVLAAIGRAIADREGTRLGWLKSRLIDRCVHVTNPFELPPIPTNLKEGDAEVGALNKEAGRLERELSELSAKLTDALKIAEEAQETNDADLATWRTSRVDLSQKAHTADKLANDVKGVSVKLDWHRRALAGVAPRVARGSVPSSGGGAASSAAASAGSGPAASPASAAAVNKIAEIKDKSSAIAEALFLPANLSVTAIIEEAQKFLEIPNDKAKKVLEKLDAILHKVADM